MRRRARRFPTISVKLNMMTLVEFGENLKGMISRRFGKDYDVALHSVRKNNGVTMLGIMVSMKGLNISPTIYVDSFYQEYIDGKTPELICADMVNALRRGMPATDFNLSYFADFQVVKEKICYRLISAKKNRELLKDIPYIPLLDLAICFYYPISDAQIGKGTILIHNSHMELWNTCLEELWRAANQNTARMKPAECIPIEHIMLEMMGLTPEKKPEDDLPDLSGLPMYVLTNSERSFGASVILYEHYLERIADRLRSDFYILPCSIHEVIIMPKSSGEDAAKLSETVKEVNNEQLELQDVLSDHIYYYDKKKKKIGMRERRVKSA